MDIKIRMMLPSDLQHVGPLYKDMIIETKEFPYPIITDLDKEIEEFYFFAMRTLRAMSEGRIPQTWLALVAVDGGVSKGFLSGGLCQRIFGQPKHYFLGEVLYVSPKFRHKGIGSALVNNACEWAGSHGAGAFEVAFAPGSRAHKEWARMGFRSYLGSAVLAGPDFKPVLAYPTFKNQPSPVLVKDPNPLENGGEHIEQVNIDTKEP